MERNVTVTVGLRASPSEEGDLGILRYTPHGKRSSVDNNNKKIRTQTKDNNYII